MRIHRLGRTWMAFMLVLCMGAPILGQEATKAKGAAALRDVFMELDENGDRVLEPNEIPATGKTAFQTLMKKGDLDHDGKLTAAEYRALLQRTSRGRPASTQGTPAAGERKALLPKRLAEMDKDGDKRISRAEFQGPGPRFDRLDSNQDGYLDKADRRSPETATARQNKKKAAKPKP